MYREPTKGLQILLSRTQAGPGLAVKEEQEEISPNHVQAIYGASVYNGKKSNLKCSPVTHDKSSKFYSMFGIVMKCHSKIHIFKDCLYLTVVGRIENSNRNSIKICRKLETQNSSQFSSSKLEF